ncbi:MAG TPA: EAL domain-containing protein [Xanthobacteraceae bacterium]|nr:EAL domain-containing protein [Xanthobacteraceae bacterium]
MARDPADELRRWSGPMSNLDETERRSLFDSMLPNGRPRIEIADALRNNWFEIWYQPKIDLKRKCLAGAEALARIRHPSFGVLLPGSFLPYASEEGTMLLAEHALLSTLRTWSTFDAAGFNLHLAINVPVSVLLKLPIPTLVRENRPKADHWPGIILEVTEDQIVRDIKQAHEIATQLRVSGITISIDDFGAGYSSFSSLRDLPFAELKLDSSFVKNCATDATNAAICQTAIDLAHRFGSAAVAEGVEAAIDLQALVVMGCDFGQGVLIAPPMPQERFLGLLRQRLNKPAAQHAAEAPAAAPAAMERMPMAAGSRI